MLGYLLHPILLLGCLNGAIIIACSTDVIVTVDIAVGKDCSEVKGSLANQTCNSLQDILVSVSDKVPWVIPDSQVCLEIRLMPGHYVLTRNFTILGHDLKLMVDSETKGSVDVSFDISESFDPTMTHSPLYVLSVVNSSLFEMKGISFWSSPGIITASNVNSVLVENCSFRYVYMSVYTATHYYIICFSVQVFFPGCCGHLQLCLCNCDKFCL